jgi:hypothetical protein
MEIGRRSIEREGRFSPLSSRCSFFFSSSSRRQQTTLPCSVKRVISSSIGVFTIKVVGGFQAGGYSE